jgi:secreted PhoX family phosphatase
MNKHVRHLPSTLALGASLMSASALHAGTDVWFTPLTQSAPVVAANAIEELSAPWVAPAGILQLNWVSLAEVENAVLSPGQTISRVPGQGTSASMFDMLACHPAGTHLFIPHETPVGAGVSRYDIYANKTELLFAGDRQGIAGNLASWANDYGAFDPCRWTPNKTLFLAEEWAGLGRVVEVVNPMAPVAQIQTRVLESFPNVSHEGINFSGMHRGTIYFIDEWNSGSIYKMVMNYPGDYAGGGQIFVLQVDDFLSTGGVPAADWNQQPGGVSRLGAATWVPLTDRWGTPLPGITNPFRDGPTNDPRTNSDTMGGRPAADDAGGTPYGRPEDMVVSRLANGREVLYVTITSENAVLSIEMLNFNGGTFRGGQAIVRTFASTSTAKNLGKAATTGALGAPDNLAMDATGNIYIIEDNPNGGSTGGDIWFVRDVNSDGVAESIDHFLSLRVAGSESTGMIFNPAVPTEFHMCVQHPNSTGLAGGLGDAVWTFNLDNIPNTAFVNALKRGRFRAVLNQ